MSLLIPLNGSYYHPPADLIIPLLPSNTNLILNPVLDNQHDPNAVEVYFSISETNFDITTINGEALIRMGFVHRDLEIIDEIMLGFLARQYSPEHPKGPKIGNIATLEFMAANPDYTAVLAFDILGKPAVLITKGAKIE